MRADTHQTYQQRILDVLLHIQRHLDEAISLEELANVAHFAPYHFHRIFTAVVGETVMEYVRRLRLERAAHELKFSDEPVTRIAFGAGYETHESFTRAFGAMFEQSPSDFRATHRSIPYKKVPSGVHFDTPLSKDALKLDRPSDDRPNVRIERIDPVHVVFKRHVGPYPQVKQTWDDLMRWAAMRGLMRGRPVIVGMPHDDPEITPSERFRYDACLVVSPDVQGEGEIGTQQIAGGEYALLTHRGPYDRLGETYLMLCGRWLIHSRRELRYGPSLEFYRSAPGTRPEDLLTDICMPLERV